MKKVLMTITILLTFFIGVNIVEGQTCVYELQYSDAGIADEYNGDYELYSYIGLKWENNNLVIDKDFSCEVDYEIQPYCEKFYTEDGGMSDYSPNHIQYSGSMNSLIFYNGAYDGESTKEFFVNLNMQNPPSGICPSELYGTINANMSTINNRTYDGTITFSNQGGSNTKVKLYNVITETGEDDSSTENDGSTEGGGNEVIDEVICSKDLVVSFMDPKFEINLDQMNLKYRKYKSGKVFLSGEFVVSWDLIRNTYKFSDVELSFDDKDGIGYDVLDGDIKIHYTPGLDGGSYVINIPDVTRNLILNRTEFDKLFSGTGCPENIYIDTNKNVGWMVITSEKPTGGNQMEVEVNYEFPNLIRSFIYPLKAYKKEAYMGNYEIRISGEYIRLSDLERQATEDVCRKKECTEQDYLEIQQKIDAYCSTENVNALKDIHTHIQKDCASYFELLDDLKLLDEKYKTELTDGCGFISDELKQKLDMVLNIIKIAGPILAIILGMLDFVKAVVSSDADKGMKDAWKKFQTRLIAAALLFIVPVILSMVMNMFLDGQTGYNSNNPYCGLIDFDE